MSDAESATDPVFRAVSQGANPDGTRQRNLSTVLSLVHRSRGISRSELTRVTGLNRSTIAALVGELADTGLVRESVPPANNRVGRPSPLVTADPGVVAFTVNPEIDAVTVGVVSLDGAVRGRIRRETVAIPTAEQAAEIAAAGIDSLKAELPGSHRAVGIGVAVPGLVHRDDGLVRLAPHLGWVDEPFSDLLREATGLPTAAANDASLGAQAESLFGAGRGVGTMVFLNGGASGVGGGVIVGGAPRGRAVLDGVGGYAGELGHTLVNSNGVACHCGAVGCLETEVGQSQLLRAFGRARGDDDDLDALLATTDDAAVFAEVERQIGFLAVALRNVINVFNPELIVLGGFLGALQGVAGLRITALATERALPGPREAVSIRRAELGSRRLLIGAAELAFAGILADPAGALRY